MGRLVNIPIWE